MSDYDYCGTDDPENIICNELDDGAAGATVMKAFDDLGFVVVRKDELSSLRADKDKLVEALAQALANCGLGTHAPPSKEEIAKAICCPGCGCLREDDCWAERPEIVRQARAVLALFGKTGGKTS